MCVCVCVCACVRALVHSVRIGTQVCTGHRKRQFLEHASFWIGWYPRGTVPRITQTAEKSLASFSKYLLPSARRNRMSPLAVSTRGPGSCGRDTPVCRMLGSCAVGAQSMERSVLMGSLGRLHLHQEDRWIFLPIQEGREQAFQAEAGTQTSSGTLSGYDTSTGQGLIPRGKGRGILQGEDPR